MNYNNIVPNISQNSNQAHTQTGTQPQMPMPSQQPYGQPQNYNSNQMPMPSQQPYGQPQNYNSNQMPMPSQQPYGQQGGYPNQMQMPSQQPYGQQGGYPNQMQMPSQQPYGQQGGYPNQSNQMPAQPYSQQNNYPLPYGNQQQPINMPYNSSQPLPPGNHSNREIPAQFSQHAQPMQIFQKYEISPQMAQRLQVLQSFKIVFIFDDSGSMNSTDTGVMTRWEELLQFASASIEVASVFNSNGSDVYFLNRPPMRNVRDSNQLSQYFRDRPQGVTPLTRTVQSVINENPPQALAGKNLLLVIATDGEPTDPYGNPNIPEFKQCLFNRPSNVFSTIVACTNDTNAIGYLNGLDKELPRLDVCDDYRSEFTEIKRSRGPQFPFSFGDYIAKTFIGSIDQDFDRSDE